MGLDVQVLTDIARVLTLGRAADQLRARVAYTYSNFRFVNNPTFNNNYLPGAPEHFIRAEVRYESALGFYIAPQFENVPKRYPVNSTNFNNTSPYALVGIQMGYTYKPWNTSLYFQGTNLADKSYISAVVTDDALGQSFFPGDVRDMVLGLSRDGGRSFAPPTLVHADGWKLTACPHRGGQIAIDSRGRLHAAWYTEGGDDTPRILFASAADGRRFDKPRAIAVAAGSVPALARDDTVAVVWEDATAVRRRVRIRASRDGGRTFAAAEALSAAVKAYAPDVAAAPGGDMIAVWHEERFPSTTTVVQRLTLRRPR